MKVQGKRELYLNEDYNQEEQQPQTEQKPASALVEKIQQLGVTNLTSYRLIPNFIV